MADYQLRKFSFIRYDDNDQEITVTHEDILDKRSTPHRAIPIDELNSDYQEYLKWLNGEDPYTEKGIPDPAE